MTTTSNAPMGSPCPPPRRPTGAGLRIICVLALAMMLQACSAVKLGYSNITTIAYWWINDYVSFTPEQGKRMRDDLAALKQWHSSVELPRYADLLDRLATQAAGTVTADQVCAAAAEVRQRLQAASHEAEPGLTALLLDLDNDQVEVLKKKYARVNADYRDDWLEATPEKRVKKRTEQVIDRGEMVYGKLDAAQREQVRQYITRSSFDPRISYTEHVRRQKEVLDTLARFRAGKPTPETARQDVAAILNHGFDSPDPVYRNYQNALQKEGCEGIAAMHNAASQEKRNAAVLKLKGYAEDARDLSTRP